MTERSDDHMSGLAGGKYKPYKLCIIGGGPAGNSVLVRAMRLGIMDELCTATETEAGVCLFDSDTSERLGGGRLQDYQINSNTWANKFYSNVCEQRSENLPPESVDGTPLKALAGTGSVESGSQAGKALLDAGDSEAPLATVGSFLVDVGRAVRENIEKHPASCLLTTNTTVTCVERVSVSPKVQAQNAVVAAASRIPPFAAVNDDACAESKSPTSSPKTVESAPTAAISSPPRLRSAGADEPCLLWKITAHNHLTDKEHVYYSKNCVFATGGKQVVPDLGNKAFNAKLISSDRVCTVEGIEEVKKRLLAQTETSSGSSVTKGKTKNKRIVIVGGSHSAFSAAWMCLHKLGLDKEQHGSLEKSSVCIMHRSAIRVFYATRKEAEADTYDNIGHVNKITGQIHPFGGLRGDAKTLWRGIKQGRETRVRLMMSTGQSMLTRMYSEAAVIIWACGYTTNTVSIKGPCGAPVRLRLDKGQVDVDERARLLTDTVVSGVTLVNKSTAEPVQADAGADAKHANATALLAPNSPKPLRGGQGLPLPPTTPTTISTTESETQAAKGYVISGLFGVGLGYGLKASLDGAGTEPDGSTGRADGVAVYLKRAATLVLASVVQDIRKVYGTHTKTGLPIESWEERIELYALEKREKKRKESGDDAIPTLEDRVRARQAMKASLFEPKTCITPPKSVIRMEKNNVGRGSTGSVPAPAAKTPPSRFPAITTGCTNATDKDKANGGAELRKSAPSALQARQEKRTVFNAATSGNLLSSTQTYVMAPEYQEKLKKQLDTAQVTKSVNRLSMPKCVASVEKASGPDIEAKKSSASKSTKKPALTNVKKAQPLHATNSTATATDDASVASAVTTSTGSRSTTSSKCSTRKGKSKVKRKKSHPDSDYTADSPAEAWTSGDPCRERTIADAKMLLQLPSTPSATPKPVAVSASVVHTATPPSHCRGNSESKSGSPPATASVDGISNSIGSGSGKIPGAVATAPLQVPKLLAMVKRNAGNGNACKLPTTGNGQSARARNAAALKAATAAPNPMYRLDAAPVSKATHADIILDKARGKWVVNAWPPEGEK